MTVLRVSPEGCSNARARERPKVLAFLLPVFVPRFKVVKGEIALFVRVSRCIQSGHGTRDPLVHVSSSPATCASCIASSVLKAVEVVLGDS